MRATRACAIGGLAAGVASLLATGLGCRRTSDNATIAIDPQQFHADRAWHDLEQLVGCGPRPSASTGLACAARHIRTELEKAGWTVTEQRFHASTPAGPREFCNLVARPRGAGHASNAPLILASHYDTKDLPGIRFVGANDGGSSVAILLEIARVLQGRVGDVELAFFDGEECQVEYTADDGLWGSRYFVEDLRAEQAVARVRGLILLDMVGDADLHVTIPSNSSGDLALAIFGAATDLGFRSSFSYRASEILDDHVPFRAQGIPAIDLIDFEYGSAPGRNDYWHTAADTLDKLSPRSLEIVGKTVLRAVARILAKSD
jgi:glutaminyl-peptide cyclotransferase